MLLVEGVLDSWLALPAIATNGRISDTGLTVLENEIISRSARIISRSAQIIAALGTLIQTPDGNFTGSGHYFTQFKWINLRINLAQGSLSKLLSSDIGLVFFNQTIDSLNSQKDEYNEIYLTQSLSENNSGNRFLILSEINGLVIGDNLLIMDNDSEVIEREIVGIVGNRIELNENIGVLLEVKKLARVAKRV